MSSLLPERKLKSLFQRPVNQLPESKDGYSLLLFWYWEECLKQRYVLFSPLIFLCKVEIGCFCTENYAKLDQTVKLIIGMYFFAIPSIIANCARFLSGYRHPPFLVKFAYTLYCRYERFIFALEEASRDVLAVLKDKALKVNSCVIVLCLLPIKHLRVCI